MTPDPPVLDTARAAPSAANLVAALRNPACYPHPVGRVEVLETHISYVLLAGEFAYKMKKPVNLGFVDFTSLEARRFFCNEEIRLNRRTAPDLYLGVSPIALGERFLVVGGEGPAVEYAVRMRRFPQEALADRVARRGEFQARHAEALARSVALLHSQAAHTGARKPYGSEPAIRSEALGNFDELETLDTSPQSRARLAGLRAWTQHELDAHAGDFAARLEKGFVRECHGDLHLGNVVLLEDVPVAFDCIEFNEELRWIDVMSDVAFAAMDLHHHGLAPLANRFLDTWLAETGDYAGLRVLRFYLVYRAMVRAKVACIRARQARAEAGERAGALESYREHLALAGRLAADLTPSLVVMHGVSGSGKSTAARALAESLGAFTLRSDLERKRMGGLGPMARTGSAPGAGLYAEERTERTYGRLAELAAEVIGAGYPVIVDATFLARSRREQFRELARELGVDFAIAACDAPVDVLRSRLASREREARDASEAGIAVLEWQLSLREPLTPEEEAFTIAIDTLGADGARLGRHAAPG
jgi:aminoglycoside phosphotransferase family enzyme/predicted kinase